MRTAGRQWSLKEEEERKSTFKLLSDGLWDSNGASRYKGGIATDPVLARRVLVEDEVP